MLKVNILSKSTTNMFTKHNGYWNFFFKYKEELNDLNCNFNFFNKINKKFFEADFLILNSRFFSNDKNKRLKQIQNVFQKNQNLIWMDMRDSAGNTQFDVMPFVKKYLKKQIYKDKNLYFKKFYFDRVYTDYYQKNFDLKKDNETDFYSVLENKDLNKLVLSWNIGVQKYFDYSKYSIFDYFLSKVNYFNPQKYLIEMYNPDYFKKNKFICEFGNKNLDISSNNILFQRKLLINIMNKKNLPAQFNKKKNQTTFYQNLKNSILSIGTFGRGEICQRDFEAIYFGSSFTTSDMSHIETWPNIYIPEKTYLPLNWDFSNLENVIERIVHNKDLFETLVYNSQKIINDSSGDVGKIYFLSWVKNIFFKDS